MDKGGMGEKRSGGEDSEEGDKERKSWITGFQLTFHSCERNLKPLWVHTKYLKMICEKNWSFN